MAILIGGEIYKFRFPIKIILDKILSGVSSLRMKKEEAIAL